MHIIGRRRTVLIAIQLMGIATIVFGAASYFSNGYIFYTISAIARAIQGFGDGACSVALPAIIAIEFTENTEFYLGLGNMALGTGLMLGPVLGVFVYKILNYAETMYFFAALILIVCNIALCFVPKRLDEKSII